MSSKLNHFTSSYLNILNPLVSTEIENPNEFSIMYICLQIQILIAIYFCFLFVVCVLVCELVGTAVLSSMF